MLELSSVSKSIGSLALRDVTVSIDEGEYFALVGPSGAGKTVLLEIAAGLVAPDNGVVIWDGRDITALAPEQRNFGLVYQDYALFSHMNVYENLRYGLRVRGIRKQQAHRRIRKVAKQVCIDHLLHRGTRTLSGGEKQRVALGRALAPRPRLLLLDEPLSSMHAGLRQQLRNELAGIHDTTGITCLHVTHSTEDVLSLAGRVGVLWEGALRQVTTPEGLLTEPKNHEIAQFLGLRNVLTVDDAGDGYCRIHDLRIHGALLDRDVTHIWIKPQEILLSAEAFSSSARNQFRCTVQRWRRSGPFWAVFVSAGSFDLTALVTGDAFDELGIVQGAELYCTFKSTAVRGL